MKLLDSTVLIRKYLSHNTASQQHASAVKLHWRMEEKWVPKSLGKVKWIIFRLTLFVFSNLCGQNETTPFSFSALAIQARKKRSKAKTRFKTDEKKSSWVHILFVRKHAFLISHYANNLSGYCWSLYIMFFLLLNYDQWQGCQWHNCAYM